MKDMKEKLFTVDLGVDTYYHTTIKAASPEMAQKIALHNFQKRMELTGLDPDDAEYRLADDIREATEDEKKEYFLCRSLDNVFGVTVIDDN